jgi:hypothetical protein
MNIKSVVTQWLKDNNYDGLCNPLNECGCGINDLFPCIGDDVLDCQPAHHRSCENCPADIKAECEMGGEGEGCWGLDVHYAISR